MPVKIFGIERIHMKYHCVEICNILLETGRQAVGLSSAGKGFLAKVCKDCNSDFVMTAPEKCSCARRESI
jgi:hypothetical protein